MTGKRRLIYAAFALLLPVIVAWFDLGVAAALALVLLFLIWRWAIAVSGIVAPAKTPELVLETIAISHFVEKVRWCMDRLGLDYTERQSAGIIGVLFTGRSVPRLKIKTGIVQSSIGNSSDILRYLWATQYAQPDVDAAFLEPGADRVALESRIDRYGRDLQVWFYYHLLDARDLTLRGWGATSDLVPAWQRLTIRAIYPLLALFLRKSFVLTDAHYAKATHNIEELLADIETRLADGRNSILGGDTSNYTDIAFAALTGAWLMPATYGGGMAEQARIERSEVPQPMRADIERWIEDHPIAIAFAEKMYAMER